MHGHGELPQAFCRFAAVKGALYVRWLLIPSKYIYRILILPVWLVCSFSDQYYIAEYHLSISIIF
jgi:hypothetical protein